MACLLNNHGVYAGMLCFPSHRPSPHLSARKVPLSLFCPRSCASSSAPDLVVSSLLSQHMFSPPFCSCQHHARSSITINPSKHCFRLHGGQRQGISMSANIHHLFTDTKVKENSRVTKKYAAICKNRLLRPFRSRLYMQILSDFAAPPTEGYNSMMSSEPIGAYGPSFASRMTVPDSRDSIRCHCPRSTDIAGTGSSPSHSSKGEHRAAAPAARYTPPVFLPSSSYRYCTARPRSMATVSDVVVCLCIGRTVPGSKAFSILCD